MLTPRSIFTFSLLYFATNRARKDPRDYLSRCLPSLPGILQAFRVLSKEQCIVASIKTRCYTKHPVRSRNSNRRSSFDVRHARNFSHMCALRKLAVLAAGVSTFLPASSYSNKRLNRILKGTMAIRRNCKLSKNL